MSSPSENERLAGLWQLVFNPAAHLAPLELPKLRTGPAFHPDNALVLAWLCQLTYERNPDKRQSLLSMTGMEEISHHSNQNLHWSRLRSVTERDHHVLAFRGTADLQHWFFNINTLLTAWPAGGKVHSGFASAYKRIADAMTEDLSDRPPNHLWITGHSLGGAFALFAANEHPSEGVYTFGCPRVGSPLFAEACETGSNIHRVVHNQDIVTTIPYEISFLEELAYKHVGEVAHLRRDCPIAIGDETHLPYSRKSWLDAAHAMIEGDHVGEPLPALLDHAPSLYVSRIQEAAGL